MHAKDEYRHAKCFFKMLSVRGKRVSIKTARDFRFAAPSLITKGYISNKGFLIDTMNFKDFIAFVYTNELLAKSSFENILALVGRRTEEGSEISSIMKDELRHHGMAKKHFLNHYPALQPWQLMIYRIRETINNKGTFQIFKTKDCIFSRVNASKAPNGSSIKIKSGSFIKHLARATLCCIPPDSW